MANRHKAQAKDGQKMTHEAEEVKEEGEAGLKRGGRAKHKEGGRVKGEGGKHRADKRARGGGVGADKNPFSSAHLK